ncbi:MAG: hypothetical protein KOO63_00110 [Bacteroidales bacterium]|nr:hypothetical protein [Candidatus Latescibacterota bacterium]
MRYTNVFKAIVPLGIALLLIFSAGCKTYKVNVKLNADGSGERSVELSMDEASEGDLKIGDEEFRKLFNLDKKGWKYIEPASGTEGDASEQKKKMVYSRTQTAKSIDDWLDMGNDIHIQASLGDKRYKDIQISNAIAVELGASPNGRSLTYRETVTCTKLREAISTFAAAKFYDKVAAAYPSFDPEILIELRGLMMGYMAITWFKQDDSEDTFSDELMTDSMVADATEIIKQVDPDADLSKLREITGAMLDDLEDELDVFVRENLPGMYLVGHAELILTLEMPGYVFEHNATSVDGNTLTWKVDFTQIFIKPLEIFARVEFKE